MSFFKQVKKFSDVTDERLMNTMRRATIMLVEDAQRTKPEGGRMPIKTGALRDSLYCTVGGRQFKGPFSYLPAVASLMPNNVFTFGWSVKYAWWQEVGTRYFPPNFFARGAVQQWEAFVSSAWRNSRR